MLYTFSLTALKLFDWNMVFLLIPSSNAVCRIAFILFMTDPVVICAISYFVAVLDQVVVEVNIYFFYIDTADLFFKFSQQ